MVRKTPQPVFLRFRRKGAEVAHTNTVDIANVVSEFSYCKGRMSRHFPVNTFTVYNTLV